MHFLAQISPNLFSGAWHSPGPRRPRWEVYNPTQVTWSAGEGPDTRPDPFGFSLVSGARRCGVRRAHEMVNPALKMHKVFLANLLLCATVKVAPNFKVADIFFINECQVAWFFDSACIGQ